MRLVLVCALLAGCTPWGKGNCVDDEWFVGPSVGNASIGTNGSNMVLSWYRSEGVPPQGTYRGALFNAGGRIAGSDFELDARYEPRRFVGAPDRALVIGTIKDPNATRSFYAIQLASGEILQPVEPAFVIRSAVYEGPGFLLATDKGLARVSLDGAIIEEFALAQTMGALVAGTTVTWNLVLEGNAITGVRITRGGGLLDQTPKPVASFHAQMLTASRNDEVVVAGLENDQLSWSVLAADGTVTTTAIGATTGVAKAGGLAMVAESNGYLLFTTDYDFAQSWQELGAVRISPAGVPDAYAAISLSGTISASAIGGRAMGVYGRVGPPFTDPPAIDAIIVDEGAVPSSPVTIEQIDAAEGHIEERNCGVFD